MSCFHVCYCCVHWPRANRFHRWSATSTLPHTCWLASHVCSLVRVSICSFHTLFGAHVFTMLIFSPACSAESHIRRNSLLAFCRRARALTSRCVGAARRLASPWGSTRTQRRGARGKNLVNLHRARFLRASMLCGCMAWPSIFLVYPFHLLKDPCTSIVAWCNIFAKHCKDFGTKTSKNSRQSQWTFSLAIPIINHHTSRDSRSNPY
jgi:hypothetical protein